MKLKEFILRKARPLILKTLKPYVDEIYLNTPKIYGAAKRVNISKLSKVSNTLFNTFSGNITVEDYAFMGHNVSLLTGTHDIGLIGEERMSDIPTKGRNIIVGEGVWIGSNSIILGPCKIGKNSVIAANSVVLKDVGEGVLVGGAPAREIKRIFSNAQS
jgi:acetyltransferase-like isoleucine patch superfamily enzyme